MVRLEKISKKYGDGEKAFYALNEVSLHVDEGEFLMVMGRSGCGKSTLLNVLGLVDTFDSGTYQFAGSDIGKLSSKELVKIRRKDIGYIYQAYNLIDELNCLDNVELVQGYAGVLKWIREERAMELLDQMGLKDKAYHFPQQLSGGQQQRVAIARALSNYPKLVLADEPTGNLDYSTGLEIMELLKSLNRNQGLTVVMVTHDQELIPFASRVVHMQDGKITE